jgi:hypothetical protein
MEPKLIKEEVPDRDNGSSSCISNSKELPRGVRQSTPPAHLDGGGGAVSRTPKAKGKSIYPTAPWYVSNFSLHNDLHVPFITEEIDTQPYTITD